MKVETLTIKGMHCGHCADLVKNSVQLVNGVSMAEVAVGSARVTYDETVASKDDIKKAVTRFGYKVVDF